MSLFENIMLFLPLNLAICIVYSALRRELVSEIIRSGLRLFAYLSVMIVLACTVVHFVMEWLLG